MIKNELIKKKQEVLTGSSYLVDSNKVALNRSDYMVEYMALNKAYMLDLKK